MQAFISPAQIRRMSRHGVTGELADSELADELSVGCYSRFVTDSNVPQILQLGKRHAVSVVIYSNEGPVAIQVDEHRTHSCGSVPTIHNQFLDGLDRRRIELLAE